VQLYWVYITAWANTDGVVHFRNDICGLDGLDQYAQQVGTQL
jgi:murein L,D-transpeptidase YcbB/YkuD